MELLQKGSWLGILDGAITVVEVGRIEGKLIGGLESVDWPVGRAGH